MVKCSDAQPFGSAWSDIVYVVFDNIGTHLWHRYSVFAGKLSSELFYLWIFNQATIAKCLFSCRRRSILLLVCLINWLNFAVFWQYLLETHMRNVCRIFMLRLELKWAWRTWCWVCIVAYDAAQNSLPNICSLFIVVVAVCRGSEIGAFGNIFWTISQLI